MPTVISVENLSKSYRLGQIGTGTISRNLEAWWTKVRSKPNHLLRISESDHENIGYILIFLSGNSFWKENIGMENLMTRITFNEQVLHGKPLIRGLRISVEMILELLAKGATTQEILQDYPELEPVDIQAALTYAQHLVTGEVVLERTAA
jgi:uncharacterized protein (DUF433 family)